MTKDSSPVVGALEAEPSNIQYNPPDNEFNIWMYGMIFVGCAFVLFVLASVYVMCNSPTRRNESATPMRRIPTVRERQSGRAREAL